jgi:hypothetical protein
VSIGARSASLGQALTARPSRDGFFFNPASIAGSGMDSAFALVLHHETTIIGQNNAVSLLLDAPLAGTFGVTYVHMTEGETEATNETEITGMLSLYAWQVIASYATSVGGLRAGASLRVFHRGMDCAGNCQGQEVAGTTPLLDFGVQYRPSLIRNLELGAAISHVGPGHQLHNAAQADPTPARLRVGAAYEVSRHLRLDSVATVWLSADLVNRVRSLTTPGRLIKDAEVGAGVEVAFERLLYLRAGYSGTTGGGGLGIGLNYQRYTLDVAQLFSPEGQYTDGNTLLISFGITF